MGPQRGYDPREFSDDRDADLELTPMLALDQEPLAVLS
jgi:hypothetical protein